MSENSAKVSEKSGKGPEVREKSANLFSHGNLIMAAQQNLPVLYWYCNSFLIRDVHGEFGSINVHLFYIFLAI